MTTQPTRATKMDQILFIECPAECGKLAPVARAADEDGCCNCCGVGPVSFVYANRRESPWHQKPLRRVDWWRIRKEAREDV